MGYGCQCKTRDDCMEVLRKGPHQGPINVQQGLLTAWASRIALAKLEVIERSETSDGWRPHIWRGEGSGPTGGNTGVDADP